MNQVPRCHSLCPFHKGPQRCEQSAGGNNNEGDPAERQERQDQDLSVATRKCGFAFPLERFTVLKAYSAKIVEMHLDVAELWRHFSTMHYLRLLDLAAQEMYIDLLHIRAQPRKRGSHLLQIHLLLSLLVFGELGFCARSSGCERRPSQHFFEQRLFTIGLPLQRLQPRAFLIQIDKRRPKKTTLILLQVIERQF